MASMPFENVILTTDNCRYCLMCRHVCPVGHVTRRETLTPHGWGLTIASVRRGLLSWDPATVDVLYSCADCGTCRSFCVTDQPLPDAIAQARAQVAEARLAPERVYEIHAALQKWENPYAEHPPEPAQVHEPVALFVGDNARHLWPTALQAAQKILGAAGINPTLIGIGRNNGYLASSLGFPETATRLAQANLDELTASGARELLVLSPGDYYAFSQLYPERLGLRVPEGVEVIDVVCQLAVLLGEGILTFKRANTEIPYAYIDPSHAVRVNDRHGAPRKLLSAVLATEGRELFWRRERAHPVGDTALRFTQPFIADHLTWSRLDDARRAGAELVITEDPSTLAVLSEHAGRFKLHVKGLYELLAEHLS